ncbi:toprim domain-containing protein [Thermoplasma volcanium]|nr:toprim domain-containing protein [Thermoplasma volcanium]
MRRYRRKNSSIPIIVEGRNDLASLRKLSFYGEIIVFNRGISITSFSDEISNKYREVIILTDFDNKGSFLKDRFYGYLTGMGVYVDLYLWNFIRKHVPIRTVEELPAEFEREVEKEIQM